MWRLFTEPSSFHLLYLTCTPRSVIKHQQQNSLTNILQHQLYATSGAETFLKKPFVLSVKHFYTEVVCWLIRFFASCQLIQSCVFSFLFFFLSSTFTSVCVRMRGSGLRTTAVFKPHYTKPCPWSLCSSGTSRSLFSARINWLVDIEKFVGVYDLNTSSHRAGQHLWSSLSIIQSSLSLSHSLPGSVCKQNFSKY